TRMPASSGATVTVRAPLGADAAIPFAAGCLRASFPLMTLPFKERTLRAAAGSPKDGDPALAFRCAEASGARAQEAPPRAVLLAARSLASRRLAAPPAAAARSRADSRTAASAAR